MADHVAPLTPCWKYMGTLNAAGYGQHRRIYERFVKPVPEGLVLDHLCRNKWCVNPDHLEPVSQSENIRRGAGDFCVNGHPRNEDNVKWDGPHRICRPCKNANARRLRARRRVAAA